MVKLGSLFDGIGGFPYSATKYGITPVWASEIEPWPIKVTEYHYPDMVHLGDITKINGAEIEPVDIITFGSPCQDVSVSGKREGLSGERSGLFWVSIRIIEQMQYATNREYPKFLVFENVPGLLSSNNGDDARLVLDALQDLGFILDPNILDAQYMGVPQRRRRVFITCISADYLLKQRTITSVNTTLQLLTECLLINWNALLKAYEDEQGDLDSPTRQIAEDGLQRRTKLFSLQKEGRLNLLLSNLKEMLVKCQTGQESLALNPGAKETTQELIGDTQLLTTLERAESIPDNDMFTPLLWKNILDGSLLQKSECIILTPTNETIESKIYFCAKMLLNTGEYICQLKNYCPNLLTEGLSVLAGIEEAIIYARQTNDDLFADMEWIHRWMAYIERASSCAEQLERYIGESSASEVLFIEPCLRGDSQESGKEGQGVAATTGDGVENVSSPLMANEGPNRHQGFSNTQFDAVCIRMREGCDGGGKGPLISEDKSLALGCSNDQTLIMAKQTDVDLIVTNRIDSTPEGISGAVSSKWAKCTGGPAGDECYNLVVEPRSQDGVCRIYEDGVVPTLNTAGGGQRQPCVISVHQNQCGDVRTGDVANTLSTNSNPSGRNAPLIAFAANQRDEVRDLGDKSGSLQAEPGMKQQTFIKTQYAVRRLTPLETVRLQGFPDYWLDIEGMSDTAKYKAIGNSVAIPCVEFVMSGIARVMKENNQCR